MRLGLGLGYGGEPAGELVTLVEHADRIGIDSVWSLEEYGPDGVTVLAYLAARTTHIKLGTGILQMPARTPTTTAMTAMALDMLSDGRVLLGLGLSVPWIVEGWHGVPYGRPLARTRDYVEIVRKAIAGDKRLEHVGDEYQVPFRGPGSTGAARPVKSSMQPVRSRIPIYLGSVGPRNVALAGEIADGWLPGFYAPENEAVFTGPLDQGLRRAGRERADVDIAVIVQTVRHDVVAVARDRVRPLYAGFIGPKGLGMGNSYFDLACQMGFEGEAHAIREHHLAGRRNDAIAAVPDALLDQVALLGPIEAIVDRLGAWKESRVGTLILLTRDAEVLDAVRDAL